jgi:hypothetical protein
MKHRLLLLACLFSCLIIDVSFGQESRHFYNVDSEKKIEGVIQEIRMEPRYKETSPFLVIKLEEKSTQTVYNVEVSPIWFFDQDFHKGEDLTVIGSYYLSEGKTPSIIAREMQYRGTTLALRDKHGFPNWRGGQMKGKARKRGKGKKGS